MDQFDATRATAAPPPELVSVLPKLTEAILAELQRALQRARSAPAPEAASLPVVTSLVVTAPAQAAPVAVALPATPSAFSPVAGEGAMDGRVPAQPFTRTDRRAGSFPPSLPGESLAQYALRTAPQTGFKTEQLGALLATASSTGAGPDASLAELVDRSQNPTAYWSDAELSRQNAMRERDLVAGAAQYQGPVAVGSLTDEDKLYLFAKSEQAGHLNVHFRVLNGSQVEIARVINWAAYNGGSAFDVRTYSGPLKGLVEADVAPTSG